MDKKKIIEELKKLSKFNDPEEAHYEADKLLLEFIGDEGVTEAFDEIKKWYA